MKIRNGFVSNSSSSSFVCCACGHTESGMDASPRDLGFVQCPNGHVLCEDDLTTTDAEIISRNDDDDGYREYDIEESSCPVCNFIVLSDEDTATYLLKKYGISRDDVFAEIKKLNKRRKKLYNNEYVMYVCTKFGITGDTILNEIKTSFKTYSDYLKFLK